MCRACPSARRAASWTASPRSDGRGWCRRCLPGGRPSPATGRKAVDSSETALPTACQPTTRWLSRRATTRTKPSLASRVMARPLAANGKLATRQSRPASFACSGDNPATTTSGSVEAHRGDRHRGELATLAGDQLGDHLALGHGRAREHRLAGEIAYGPDIAHRGAALVVDLHRPAVLCPGPGFPGSSLRCAACGRPPPVPGRRRSRAPRRRRRGPARRSRSGPAGCARGTARRPACARPGPPAWSVLRRSPAGCVVALPPPPPRRRACGRRYPAQADVAAADHHQALGQAAGRQRLGGGDHLAAQRQDR